MGIRYEVGTTHSTNQDACCVKVADTPDGEVVMAVMCDGVGGLSLGELASSSVASSFGAWFERRLPYLFDSTGQELFSAIEAEWAALLQDLDEAIRQYGEEIGSSLATTCTAMLCMAGAYTIAHVGDCRVYEVCGDRLTQLTEDQTLVARELARGAITPEQVRTFPGENVILQAVGAPNGIVPTFYRGTTSAEAIYILATDGAYRKVGGEAAAKMFKAIQPNDEQLGNACERLIASALDAGETDNLTALAFTVDEGRC